MTDYMKGAERLIAAHESAIRQHDRGAEWDEGPAKTLSALLAHIQRGAVLDKPARVGNGTFGAGGPTRYVIEAAQRLYEAEAERGPRTLEQIHEDERVRRKTWEMFNGPLTGSEDIQRGAVPEALDPEFLIGYLEEREDWRGREVLIERIRQAAAPDPFCDAAADAPAPAEVPMPEPDATLHDDGYYVAKYHIRTSYDFGRAGWRLDVISMAKASTYGAAREAAGYARGIDACVAALVALKPQSGVNGDGSNWLVRISRQDCVEACAALRGEVK